MKKLFTLIIIWIGLLQSDYLEAQGKFSATVAAGDNSITFKLKPNVTSTNGFSTIEFFLRYPVGTTPFTYGAVVANTTNFPGMTSSGGPGSGSWEIERNNPLYLIAGYNVDHFIYTAPAPITTTATYTGGTEYELITVPINGVIPTDINYQFVHQDNEAQYYLAITDENGGDLRPVDLTNYFYPATSTTTGPLGSTIYYMPLAVTLPLQFISFNARKDGSHALVNWQVANQVNNDYFEVQVSNDGRSFSTIGRVPATEKTSYSFTDASFYKLQGAYAQYRIKQVDKDGKATYSEIRKLLITGKDFAFTIAGNPVTAGQLNIGIQSPENSRGVITILDLNGKKVFMKNITWSSGYSQQSLSIPFLAGGTYTANLITASGQLHAKFVK